MSRRFDFELVIFKLTLISSVVNSILEQFMKDYEILSECTKTVERKLQGP